MAMNIIYIYSLAHALFLAQANDHVRLFSLVYSVIKNNL